MFIKVKKLTAEPQGSRGLAAQYRRAKFLGLKGFTMMEVIVVAAIIAILAVIIIPTLVGKREVTSNARSETTLKQALASAQIFYSQNKTYDPGSAPAKTLCNFLKANNPRVGWWGQGCGSSGGNTTGNYSDPTQETINVKTVSGQKLILCSRSETGRYYCIQDDNTASV